MKRTNVHNLKEMNNERNNKEYTIYFLCNWIQNLKILLNGHKVYEGCEYN